jgi:DNA-binding CsgD family transcriptional regulator/uncharacterized protein (UPF0335 family)
MEATTKEERQRRVLELLNQGKGTRETAEIMHMSFRDIGVIKKEADKNKEIQQQQTREQYQSSRAYKLFSEGKSPVQVAIELNIKAQQAITFQREYWDLEGCHNLNKIYEEIKGDTWHLVDLNRSIKAAGMGVPDVVILLNVAKNDLPTLEYRYERLEQEVNSLQERKRNLYNQVTEEGSNLEYYRVACQREIAKFKDLQQRRLKEEALVGGFQNNNAEYVKIIKTVEEKASANLTNGKKLIQLAVLSVTESLRENPAKYNSLIQQDMSSTTGYFNSDFNPFNMYGQDAQDSKVYFIEDNVAMLTEDAAKIFENLAKKLGDEVISGYTVSTSPKPSLQLLSSADEDFPPKTS